jgi:hypothetical protein
VLIAIVLAGAFDDLVVGERARRLADQALLVGQLEVDVCTLAHGLDTGEVELIALTVALWAAEE